MSLWTQMQKAEERRKAAEKAAPIKPANPEKIGSVKPTSSQQPTKRPRGRPHSGNETVTLRISSAVLDYYRATGPGWQSRLNADLRKIAGV